MRHGEFYRLQFQYIYMKELKRNLTARYFSLDEILAKNDRSELIDLIQDPAKVANIQSLLSVLDDLRLEFGKPIIINSFYRDSAHNIRVGGVKTSKHLRGAAVDITSPDFDNLYQVVIHSIKQNWRVLPYIKRKFLHLELIRYN